ncbi:MAG: hypothetical protein ABR922_15010 [Streptosporangiaceae bacterium]
MRGLKRCRSARILATGHASVQDIRRGHYDLATLWHTRRSANATLPGHVRGLPACT